MFMKPLFILNLGFKIENERSAVDNNAATPTAPFVTADVAAHVIYNLPIKNEEPTNK